MHYVEFVGRYQYRHAFWNFGHRFSLHFFTAYCLPRLWVLASESWWEAWQPSPM